MNFDGLSLWLLSGIFIAAAVIIWIAGIHLASSTDTIAKRTGLGQALGGLIMLAIVTNLPEVVITISAAMQDNVELAVGNILGGIAIQTLVLAILDFFGLGSRGGLIHKAASMQLLLEGLLVLAVLILVIMGHQLPQSLIFLRITPSVLLICFAWVTGLYLINKARDNMPWVLKDDGKKEEKKPQDDTSEKSTAKTIIIFTIASAATLVAGYLLERSGDILSKRTGVEGVIFGATVLAAATSLPEISTGLASLKLKDYNLAVSDIFGGNAFLPVLFLAATLFSGKAVLPQSHKSDIYLTCLAMMLTSVYVWGIVFKSQKQIFNMGIDSFIVVLLYLAGIAGLFAVI